MSVSAEHLSIDGPVGALEAMLEKPAQLTDGVAAVVCHPHPQFQGTMFNKVVHTLSRGCTDLGIPALRFNYRGVGESAGSFDDGKGETMDAGAAVQYMQNLYPDAVMVLAGFSFGAGVAIRHAMQTTPAALISVAPPVGRLGVPEQTDVQIPWLLVQGGADELVDSADVLAWAKQQKPSPEVHLMAGVSHFFHGNLTRLRQITSAFLQERLNLSPDIEEN